ncbi:MAG: hypothetical protein WB662_06240 [Methyloceanibacter sp.]
MSGLYHSRAHRLLAPYTQGAGVIFTLHHVRPAPAKAFAPNRILEVSPEFLDAVLDQVQEAGLDVVSLDEAARRLKDGEARRFVCFTFDDGYRDTLTHAHPLFRRRSLPLTIYAPTDYRPRGASFGGLHSRRSSPEPRRSSFATMARYGVCPPRRCRRNGEASNRSIGGSAPSTRPHNGRSCAPLPTVTRSTCPRCAATW